MKIGIDARFYGSLGKGLGRYTEKLITHLEQIPDDEHTYVVFLRRENFDEYQPANPRFQKLIADYRWYGWTEQIVFPIRLWRERLDLIHFPHFNVPLLLGKPFVVTIHDLILLHFPTVKASELSPFLYWLKYLAYRVVIASAIHRARAIIVVSDFTKRDVQIVYPNAQHKIYTTLEAADPFCHWLDPESAHELLSRLGLIESDTGMTMKRFVLYVGNAYPHKNLGWLIEVAKKFPETVFLCVGKEDFFYRSFQEKVTTARVGNIRFAGYVDDRALGALYQRASAYLFPSFYEGFGLPGLEAMNHGVPVIAARAGSLPEIYGDAAVYFDPAESETGVAALRQVFSETNRLARQSFGFHHVAQFSWQTMAAETLQLYNREAPKTSLKKT